VDLSEHELGELRAAGTVVTSVQEHGQHQTLPPGIGPPSGISGPRVAGD
jgi:hypothetical protein